MIRIPMEDVHTFLMKYPMISKVIEGHKRLLLCMRPSDLIITSTDVIHDNICPYLDKKKYKKTFIPTV